MATPYSVVLKIDNRLLANLTDPKPNLIHGVLNAQDWPVVPMGTTSSEIRINSLNPEDGVQGSISYISVLQHARKVTFNFKCNSQGCSATAESYTVVASARDQSANSPLTVSYVVKEIID